MPGPVFRKQVRPPRRPRASGLHAGEAWWVWAPRKERDTWRTTIVPEVVVSGLLHMCCTTTIYHYGPFRYVPTMSMLCDILVRRVVLCTGRCVRYHPWSLWSVKVVYASLHWSSILVSTLVSNYGLYDCLYGRCWNSMPSKTAPGTSRELGVWRERERERERERMTESVLAKWEGTNYTRMYALSQTNMLNLFLSSIVDTSYGCPLVRPSPLVVRLSFHHRWENDMISIGMQCPERNARPGTRQHRYACTLCDTGCCRGGAPSLPPPHLCPQYTIERASNALKGEGIEDGVEWLSDAIKKTAPRQTESKFK